MSWPLFHCIIWWLFFRRNVIPILFFSMSNERTSCWNCFLKFGSESKLNGPRPLQNCIYLRRFWTLLECNSNYDLQIGQLRMSNMWRPAENHLCRMRPMPRLPFSQNALSSHIWIFNKTNVMNLKGQKCLWTIQIVNTTVLCCAYDHGLGILYRLWYRRGCLSSRFQRNARRWSKPYQ